MAINFIRNIIEGNADEHTHSKFTRYGKGEYEKEELKIKSTGKNITIQAGPDFASVLVKLMAEFAEEDVSVKGKMVAKKGQESRFADAGIELVATRATTYTIDHTFSADEFRKFVEDFKDFMFLLTITSGANQVKIKPKVPKPGNIIEKFCTAKFDKKHLARIQEEFLPEFPNFKKEATFKHWYLIDEIVVDSTLVETDPLKARLEAKRKGKLKRNVSIDGLDKEEEFQLEA